jgi:hypothetical protein
MSSLKIKFTRDDTPPTYVNAISATLFAGDILIEVGYANPRAISGRIAGEDISEDEDIFLETSSTVTLAMSPEVASGLVEILKTVLANNSAIETGANE